MPERDLGALAPVIMLRPIRTLVIARDLAFRQRAVTVLGELGVAAFAVAPLDVADEVVALVGRERPDVVVLDSTGCEAAVAPVVYDLCEVAPRIGVVLVSGARNRTHALPTVDKWGWAEELRRAVQEAYRRGNPLREESFDVHLHPG